MEEKNHLPEQFLLKEAKNNVMHYHLKRVKEANLPKKVEDLAVVLLKSYKNGYGYFDYSVDNQKLEDLKPLCEGISWRDNGFLSLFEVLYGKEYAPFVVEALESMGEIAYQKGYTRRSFRAPSQKEIVLENQLDLLVNLCNVWQDEGKYYALPPYEVLKYGNRTTNPAYVLPLAKKIDSGDKEIFELLENIAFAREGFEGKVSYFFVKVLLASKKRECWELVGKLLVSAQRQEGLRQVIMESVDERSCPEALHFMIDLVLKEKLTRFSSVVRAVDVWFGLGFEAEKETTIKKILSLASDFLSDEKKAHQTLQNFDEKSDNIALYTAFWAISLKDVALAMPYLETMVKKGNVQKQCLAIYIANELRLWAFQQKIYQKAFENPSMETLSMMMTSLNWVLKSNESREIRNDELFERVFSLANTFEKKEVSFEGLVFSWTISKFERSDLYRCAFYLCGDNETNLDRIIHHFNEYDGNLREEIVREMFGEWYCYGFSALNRDNVSYGNRKKVQLTPKYRQLAFQWLTDRIESIQATSFNVLGQKELTQEELFSLSELFARKGQGFRKQLSILVLKQKDELIKSFIENLLQAKSVEERTGGLDLLNALHQDKKFPDFVQQKASEYSQRKLSKAEETLLSRITPTQGSVAEVLSAENGYGVFNPQNITPWELPKVDENGFYAQRTGYGSKKGLLSSIKNAFSSENYEGRNYGFSKDWSLIKKDLDNLVALFKKHKDYEYEIESWDKSKEMVLLGNEFRSKIYHDESLTPRERFESYPLWEVWEEWFKQTKMDACDLFLLTTFEENNRKKYRDFLEKYIFYQNGNIPRMEKYDWKEPIRKCLYALKDIYPFEEKNDFLIDLACNIYQNLPKEIIELNTKNEEKNYWSSDDNGYGWQGENCFTEFLSRVDKEKATDIQFKKLWNIYRFVQYTGRKENISLNKPILEVAAPCYQMGYITKDELVDCILTKENLKDASMVTTFKDYYRSYLFKQYPFIGEIVKEIQDAFLPVEVVRGDLNTPVTHFVLQFLRIEGAKYAIAMLAGLGKKSFNRGYIWYSSSEEITKQKLFSLLIKRCQPSKDDTQEVFNDLVKAQGKELSQERLIEMAMYAPQWHRFVSEYLGWKGLDSGIWWMHAHTKTSEYQARSSEFESEVARYSSLDLEDFKLGAVDKPWFDKAFGELGSERWEILYNSAKYISEGNGHRRAKIYSDTLTGVYSLSDVWGKVQDKRDQEFLRVYGLVALNKKEVKKDLLTRYENLLQFKKESRQFGSMKQASEAIAYGVALDNLARNAGYTDPQRLSWAMEVEQVNQIFAQATSITIDSYDFSLVIDEQGKAEINITKDGKALKSVPASLKKNEQVLELTAHRKTLREQLSRARKGLEEAMIRGDEFSLEEMEVLFTHPVIEKLLSKLLLTDGSHIGFFVEGKLKDAFGELHSIKKTSTLSLAHCYDMHQKGVWIDFQRYAFDEKLIQPFKQIFRELYVPNEDELKEVTISRRYAGHQVQPKQTLALLKSRGWKVDYEEGLQKVYHKEGFQVKLYAMADWFSPSDIEAPTLETIEFHSLKDDTNVPFKDINPLIFSEVMRDIDLVVSVAYVGATDPEMSQSTIEMRSFLMAQTLRLFKIDNVELKKSHAQIKGHFSEYSVHLGSGIVHQMGKGAMQVIPVHSQHRGRVFLPFVDDDPKTAEIISKVLLLAKDKEIKDPTILQQIK